MFLQNQGMYIDIQHCIGQVAPPEPIGQTEHTVFSGNLSNSIFFHSFHLGELRHISFKSCINPLNSFYSLHNFTRLLMTLYLWWYFSMSLCILKPWFTKGLFCTSQNNQIMISRYSLSICTRRRISWSWQGRKRKQQAHCVCDSDEDIIVSII